MRLKIDLHIHTCYSYDSLVTPKELIFYAKKRGLDGLAITDHNRIDGALKIAKETDFTIIPGIEVSSSDGHVLGLNVQEQIPKWLSISETVDKIHEAGGIAVACHPVTFFKISLGEHTNSKLDAVEVINSSAFPFKHSVKRSKKMASRLEVAQVAGSDAHYGPEIGCAYTIIESERTVEEIIKAISKGICQPFGGAIPLKTRLKRQLLLFKRRYG
ncbi:MAG: CehA/McbA family metallohydrolase [Candidatus Bathyarchaeota archaeon]|nr:CehA/McbA family metallohydrolase [Candidatus Bathyarchaeota archaeon]MDH5787840.1 CehA/McbA family metallohydrolase [Candidatus Bathyarchaeota archaeon]